MSATGKHKIHKNAIVLEDIVFKLGVREVSGVIHGQQNIPCFVSEEEHVAIPLDFNVPAEMYEEEVTAYLRTYDKSLVIDLGEDDVLVSEIDTEAGEVDITDPAMIAGLFEEQKIRKIPQVMSGIGATVLSVIVAVVFLVLKLPLFPFVTIPACIGVFGLVWSVQNYMQLNRAVAYDAVGNWIDLTTGETSLNGGEFYYRIEVSE